MSEFRPFLDGDRRALSITRQQSRDLRTWERARTEAARLGVELVVVPDPVPPHVVLELDDEGCATTIDGHRYLPIGRTVARDFRQYTRMRDRAQALDVPWHIVDDRDLPPGPDAA